MDATLLAVIVVYIALREVESTENILPKPPACQPH